MADRVAPSRTAARISSEASRTDPLPICLSGHPNTHPEADMIPASPPPPPPHPIVHSQPIDTCTGCQNRAIVGRSPAAWSYCTLHITPRARFAHYTTDATAAAIATNRLAGRLQCK